jgi:hypothetical protein
MAERIFMKFGMNVMPFGVLKDPPQLTTIGKTNATGTRNCEVEGWSTAMPPLPMILSDIVRDDATIKE